MRITDIYLQSSPVIDIDPVDFSETVLAYLLYGDAEVPNYSTGDMDRVASNGDRYSSIDTGDFLEFDPMSPSSSFISFDEGRIFGTDGRFLINNAQDIIGESIEMSFVNNKIAHWHGFRPLKKRPRRVWVAEPGATLYEHHYKAINAAGVSTYARRVAAINSKGMPVATVFEGAETEGADNSGRTAIIACGFLEESSRANTIRATVKEHASMIFAVPLADYKYLFALRDAPMSDSGRRKSILHWVAKHARRTKDGKCDVKQHFRGVREITVSGLSVSLECNPLHVVSN